MITPGLYRMRSGNTVQIVKVDGHFAHNLTDFWHAEDGKYVPRQSNSQRNGQPIAGPHRLDLVERIGVLN